MFQSEQKIIMLFERCATRRSIQYLRDTILQLEWSKINLFLISSLRTSLSGVLNYYEKLKIVNSDTSAFKSEILTT